ncbi:hypothetical protein [Enterococcus faecalis]|uniref:hypothetical protein n=1 Tax=Enterococcus TaxID=1350 RepID=UPI0004A2D752|nr:hypothetical protein [Enterococcus faecalis]KXF69137.1 hypothetical protein AQ486_15480 [Enterococcus faecalis]KXF73125.1 hypothetical protein AQ487_08740 [Enterococcus faecalis]MBC2811809.1 hypothetical protein [Enterococcus faecalis]MBC2816062.1 hypothetical protein [Enterococcus faecalis]MBC2818604.1 hypothetical protein [Enterococcus faecalis]
MKDIIKNYIPNQYKIRSKKKITTRTIKRGLYILLATFLLQIFYYVFGNDIVIDKLFLDILTFITIFIIVVNLSIYLNYVFKSSINKWAGIFFYVSMIVDIFLILGCISFLLDNSFETFVEVSIATLVTFVIAEILYLFSIKRSVIKNNYKIRDKFFNFLLNGVSLLGIVFLFISDFTDNWFLGILGCACILIMTLLLATIHLNRILLLWKPNNSNNDQTSIYGNSIEMMKNKKTKK